MLVATVTSSLLLLLILGGLVAALILVRVCHRRRGGKWCLGRQRGVSYTYTLMFSLSEGKREKREGSEEGMYDNPLYNGRGSSTTEPPAEAVYEEPLPHSTTVQECPYHKVINPLYSDTTSSNPSLHSPIPWNQNMEPYYATPSSLNPHSQNMYQSPLVAVSVQDNAVPLSCM